MGKRALGTVLITTAAVVALTVGGCAGPAGAATHPSASFPITGYAEVGATTTAQLKASTGAMSMVGIDGVSLTSDGDGIERPSSGALTLLAQAHVEHDTAELLVSNYSNDIGDFDDALAEKLFDDPQHISDVTAALAAEVTAHHWDGITVDLEALNGWGADGHTRDDNAGLVDFVTALRGALGDKDISICLTATTGSYADLGYDVPELAAQVDHLVLMAYDEHGPTWSGAGPIGGYSWAKTSAAHLAAQAGAKKVQLGIAGYGYSWAHGRQQKTGDVFSDASARAWVKKHHATARWSETQKEWHATDAAGTVLWWSDARSFRARVAMARALHLGGVAVWSLGQSDPLR